MNNTSKAVKATILLGNVELDVFQLPDGSYILAKNQTCSAIELNPKRLSELLETKALQTHMPSGLRMSGKVHFATARNTSYLK